jgi:hypothetical protein
MQEISIHSGSPPVVYRPEGPRVVYMTFEGLRESRTIADKLTRVRVALAVGEVQRLRHLLGELVPEASA